jgi:hypothetical protein
MLLPLEPLFCPCCTPALLHALAQSGYYSLTQPLNLLGSGALLQALKLTPSASRTVDSHQGDTDFDHCVDVA